MQMPPLCTPSAGSGTSSPRQLRLCRNLTRKRVTVTNNCDFLSNPNLKELCAQTIRRAPLTLAQHHTAPRRAGTPLSKSVSDTTPRSPKRYLGYPALTSC
jgi:hypothetical protein